MFSLRASRREYRSSLEERCRTMTPRQAYHHALHGYDTHLHLVFYHLSKLRELAPVEQKNMSFFQGQLELAKLALFSAEKDLSVLYTSLCRGPNASREFADYLYPKLLGGDILPLKKVLSSHIRRFRATFS